MYLFLAAVSPTVIAIVFGVAYLEGVPVMMVFCLRYAFNGVNGVCGALQTATGRTDIGLIWTVFLICSTAIIYYISSLFGITVFLCGICLLILITVIMVWLIQFRPMVNVSFREYMSIFLRSFIICIILSGGVYLLYSEPSLLYSVLVGIAYVTLFVFIIMKSKDRQEILEVMELMNVPEKYLKIAQKI